MTNQLLDFFGSEPPLAPLSSQSVPSSNQKRSANVSNKYQQMQVRGQKRLLPGWMKVGDVDAKHFKIDLVEEEKQKKEQMGPPCKIGNMRCPGTLKNQNPQFEEKNKFFCFFMFLYPIQGGKNNGSPYLTNKSWFLANLMSRDNKIKVTLVLWHPRTLFF